MATRSSSVTDVTDVTDVTYVTDGSRPGGGGQIVERLEVGLKRCLVPAAKV